LRHAEPVARRGDAIAKIDKPVLRVLTTRRVIEKTSMTIIYKLSDDERSTIERSLADMHERRFADEETIAAIDRKARTAPANPRVAKSAR
jgi:hypothetical protein